MSLDDWSTRFETFVDRVNNQDDYRQMQWRLIAGRLVEERGLPRDLREARASMSRQDALRGRTRMQEATRSSSQASETEV